jgi:hypothetical protein
MTKRDSVLTHSGGQVAPAPTQITVRVMPNAVEVQRLETDLRERFNNHLHKLLHLYCLAEKYSINDLMNRAVDEIQNGFHKYGTVFGPGLSMEVFKKTKESSKLRDLCVAANILHTDRGCCQLREEIMMVSFMNPDYLAHLFQWISRNFAMFGRREREGFDNSNPNEGFSVLNRAKLCSCHFHEHRLGEAHEGHEGCAIQFLDCDHIHDDSMVE